MDIYRYINSVDIAKHLKKIGYQFSPVEKAWLIWQCKTATMAERHRAWDELISTTSDCAVEKMFNVAGWNSIHEMLIGFMRLEYKLLRIFEEDTPDTVCVFEVLEESYIQNETQKEWHGGYLSKDSGTAQAYIEQWDEPVPYRIKKQWIDSVEEMCAYYNSEKELLRIDCRAFSNFLTSEELELLCESFDGMWFDFPIPFKKGDLVMDVFREEPFVLMDTMPWYKKKHPERKCHLDSSDMYASGYSYDTADRFLYDDYMVDYMNMVYYSEPLQGPQRILEAYSRFEKKKIDAWTLLKLFRMYEHEEQANRDYRRLKSFGAVE